MYRRTSRFARQALLALAYALGVAGILASNGSDVDESSFCDLIVRGIAPTTDGSDDLWIGVLAITDDEAVDRIVRMTANGAERFGVDIAIGNDENAIRAIAIAVEGADADDLYVGGDFSEGILRLNDDGSIDNGFDVGTGFNGRVTSIVPAADGTGDIYVGGSFSTYKGSPVSGLVRLNSNATLDTGFGGSGALVSNVESLAMQGGASTNVYSGGTTLPSLERWTSVGTADTAPDFKPSVGLNPVFTVIPAPAGSDVYAGGGFANGIARLSNTGIPVMTFVVGSGFDDKVVSMVRAGAGNEIYVGGPFTTYKSSSVNGIVRLNPVGDIVGSFVIGTGFDDPRDATGGSQVVSLALATDSSNDLFVGGGFTRYKGTNINGIARLNANGSLDTTFEARISAGGRNCDNSSFDR